MSDNLNKEKTIIFYICFWENNEDFQYCLYLVDNQVIGDFKLQVDKSLFGMYTSTYFYTT